MEIDNQTNDPIDYEQSGTGPDADAENPSGPECPVTGHVPEQSKRPFVPCGRPPFEVEVKGNSRSCWARNIMNRNATVVVKSLNPCDVEVQP